MEGWLKIWRQIVNWEWWEDVNTRNVFLYVLITANYKPSYWQGVKIERAQKAIGRGKLAEKTGLTEQQVRRALNNLKKTGEITITRHSKFSLITLNNFEHYQEKNQQTPSKRTAKHPVKEPQNTHSLRRKEGKKERIIINNLREKIEKSIEPSAHGPKKEIDGMLIALKANIGIEAFADSAIERNMARHCLGLLKKIGPEEFKRRLGVILDDPFHYKNSNKIRYVYGQIKAFREPKAKHKPVKTFSI